MKAGRFLFSQDEEYVGKLIAVSKRSIENSNEDIWLLRMEFEIYLLEQEEDRTTLVPTGSVASRDIVITKYVRGDENLRKYADLLSIKDWTNPKAWYKLEGDAWAKDPRKERWIRIHFGNPDHDLRQPFVWIDAFKKDRNVKLEHGEETASIRQLYWTSGRVRNLLKNRRNQSPSEDTVNRFVDNLEEKYGETLVRRNTRGSREINWHLCWHLWEADKAR
jgi:hypothetical protein